MLRRFYGRRSYGSGMGYRRRSVGMTYGGTVLAVALLALLFLYLMGYL